MHPFPGGYPKFVNGVQGVILTCAIWRWKFSDCFSAYVRPLFCLKGKHHNMHIFSGMQSYMHVYIYTHTVIKSHGCGNFLCFQGFLSPSLKNKEPVAVLEPPPKKKPRRRRTCHRVRNAGAIWTVSSEAHPSRRFPMWRVSLILIPGWKISQGFGAGWFGLPGSPKMKWIVT